MKKIAIMAVLALSVWALQAQDGSHPLLENARRIAGADLMKIVEELASPAYEGRLTGSPGYRKAAEYLALEFESIGLQPYSQDGYFQEFTLPYTVVLPGCSLVLKRGSGERSYRYYDEFMPGSTSASGTLTAEVVFAGYGITAPELGYDDYAGIDVRGKIVLIRPEAPLPPSVGEEGFKPWLTYSTHQYKMKNALDHGVAGILYHYGPLANTNNDYHEGLLVSMVGNQVVADLFEGSGREYGPVVDGITASLKPSSFPLGKSVTIHNNTEHHPAGRGMNVIGVLPGSDPALAKEAILIGGHLDHCGMCWELCPGANDNASGIAVMLGVARALAASGHTFARTLIFMGIGGEESGLVGAREYVADPAWPLDRTTGFINLDCVGVGPNFHAGGGLSYPQLYGPIEAVNRKFFGQVLGASVMSHAGRPRTDAAVINKAGVPSLSFSSYGGPGGYHTPADNLATIWPETLRSLAAILTVAVAELAGG
ncbi:MAG: M28 family metallopeptidase [Bacteroidales bacterium]